MFWDKVAKVYDLFENVYNRKCYVGLGKQVATYMQPTDEVLECACGTGMISAAMAPRCKNLVATDFAEGMLKQAAKRCGTLDNVTLRKADLMQLNYEDASFDKVVAGNVIHLVNDPGKAMSELMRVCRPGGLVIVPTYVNMVKDGKESLAARFLRSLGADFKRQFNQQTYLEFFDKMGYTPTSTFVVEGRMPCMIAVFEKE